MKQAEKEAVLDALKTTQVALDTYDDIFSDFDFSPYSKRLLSYDFLKELRRRYAETKKGEYIITFTIPKKNRSSKTESLVRKRIKGHFKLHLKKIEERIRRNRVKGAVKVFIGFAISFLIFGVSLPDNIPIITAFSVLAWYFLWAGYSDIFEAAGKLAGKHDFYKKFLNAKYIFMDEEEVLEYVSEVRS